MEFSRQEYWSGLPCTPPGHLPDPGIEPVSLTSNLNWQAGSLPPAPSGKPRGWYGDFQMWPQISNPPPTERWGSMSLSHEPRWACSPVISPLTHGGQQQAFSFQLIHGITEPWATRRKSRRPKDSMLWGSPGHTRERRCLWGIPASCCWSHSSDAEGQTPGTGPLPRPGSGHTNHTGPSTHCFTALRVSSLLHCNR